ncbi:hypothetical protein M438DRAFT_148066 [Aureobasidium pullulans EXF-150]|uniref:Uncharacterized protein n=1 Tax=Aureobasidium pullulans EXF-150 TaxID=1043002 RepID=A0A074XXL8_AURPU|nr:uncharacterized protein M438DRAFT_148066 [Aureobasidium pullulans EXF-150]KEQ79426.1 hypothetical protein M438DRAFT_148066 [Aureobasidium pullulans EXF-150]
MRSAALLDGLSCSPVSSSQESRAISIYRAYGACSSRSMSPYSALGRTGFTYLSTSSLHEPTSLTIQLAECRRISHSRRYPLRACQVAHLWSH